MLVQDVGVGHPRDRSGLQMKEPAGLLVDQDEAAIAIDGQHAIAHISHHVAEKHVVVAGRATPRCLYHEHCCRVGLSKAHAPYGWNDLTL